MNIWRHDKKWIRFYKGVPLSDKQAEFLYGLSIKQLTTLINDINHTHVENINTYLEAANLGLLTDRGVRLCQVLLYRLRRLEQEL